MNYILKYKEYSDEFISKVKSLLEDQFLPVNKFLNEINDILNNHNDDSDIESELSQVRLEGKSGMNDEICYYLEIGDKDGDKTIKFDKKIGYNGNTSQFDIKDFKKIIRYMSNSAITGKNYEIDFIISTNSEIEKEIKTRYPFVKFSIENIYNLSSTISTKSIISFKMKDIL